VVVVGPVARRVQASFDAFWDYDHSVPSGELTDVARLIESGDFPRYDTRSDYVIADFCDDIPSRADDTALISDRFVDRLMRVEKADFLADKPGKNRSFGLKGRGRITYELRDLVEDTQQELIIQSPYFVLSPSTRKLFSRLRRKRPQLDVIVSTNSFGSTDNVYAYSANYKLRSVYIGDLGFQVYEYKPHPADLLTVYPKFEQFAQLALSEKGPDARPPFLCIHAKSCVIDGRIAFIGSYNFDPRSANLNTEVGLLVEDAGFAATVREEILNDTRPSNSWVIAQRQMPMPLEKANALLEGLMRLNPIDLWPVRNSSSFELIPGRPAVPPGHPDFYLNYTDIGSFPGADGNLSAKEITTRIYKAVGGPAVPLL
jgi:phosphatidylserine/phosphatidylglycerophosphate/cardiolipin synthase-like enzyme